MKIKNKIGYTFKIKDTQTGRDYIIPYDGNIYVIPDYLVEQYKDLFNVILEPKLIEQTQGESSKKEEPKVEEFNELIKKDKKLNREVFKRVSDMKFDVLYSFHFGEKELEKATQRLLTSIDSIKDQNVRICICNTSKDDIYEKVKHIKDLKYVHKFTDKTYCKPLTINYGVKNLVESPYFILSDIDLIYRKFYIKTIEKYLFKTTPHRIVSFNYNLGYEYYSSNFDDYMLYLNVRDPKRTHFGISPGNGLVHKNSFMLINGFDEEFKGYGCEDAVFNRRISFINNYIEDQTPELATIHIYHERSEEIEKNQQIYSDKRDNLNILENYLRTRKFDFKTDLKYIQANQGKEWGVI